MQWEQQLEPMKSASKLKLRWRLKKKKGFCFHRRKTRAVVLRRVFETSIMRVLCFILWFSLTSKGSLDYAFVFGFTLSFMSTLLFTSGELAWLLYTCMVKTYFSLIKKKISFILISTYFILWQDHEVRLLLKNNNNISLESPQEKWGFG